MNAIELQKKYETILASIDNTVAGSDQYGNLAWHVDCSSQANAGDTVNGQVDPEAFWKEAIATANMIIDCWEDYYPQLII